MKKEMIWRIGFYAFGMWILAVGAVLGKTLYRKKESLLPKVNSRNPVLRFLQFLGRHSLEIYLLHQPLLSGIFTLIIMLR